MFNICFCFQVLNLIYVLVRRTSMKKGIVIFLIAILVSTSVSFVAADTNFPQKTITVICPWGAGGGTDALARFIAKLVEQDLKTNVIVVNKTGGNGAVAWAEGAKAKPDGYTVVMTTVEYTLNPLAGMGSYSLSDYIPILRVNFDPLALVVNADSGWNTLNDLLNYAKANPDKSTIMAGTYPTVHWLTGILLEEQSGANFNVAGGVGGAAEKIQNLLGKHIDAIVVSPSEVAQQVKGGQLKILAVANDKRDKFFTNVPTFKELGFDIVLGTWRGFKLPKGVPQDVINKIETSFTKAVLSDEYKTFLNTTGFGEGYLNSKDFESALKRESDSFKPILLKYKP